MGGEQTCSKAPLQHWLSDLGFYHLTSERTGCTYHRQADDTCLIIDTAICNLSDYPYVAYTSSQNDLMAGHARMFRFLYDPETSVGALHQDIRIFLEEESDPEKINRFGGNRAEQEPDPTLPEAAFEDCFLEAFGDRARMGLHREFAYIDLVGTTRYIDFAPSHLLGVTATPERFDQQRLEKIFGEYEPQLSPEEAIRQGLVPPVRCYRVKFISL